MRSESELWLLNTVFTRAKARIYFRTRPLSRSTTCSMHCARHQGVFHENEIIPIFCEPAILFSFRVKCNTNSKKQTYLDRKESSDGSYRCLYKYTALAIQACQHFLLTSLSFQTLPYLCLDYSSIPVKKILCSMTPRVSHKDTNGQKDS